jgi:peptide/nickel transport system substrate-binding protein
VTIEQVPPDSYWTDIWGVEPLFVDGYPQLPADVALHLFLSGDNPENATRFANAEYEQLLASARAAPDAAERRQLYQQAQELLYAESGMLIPFVQVEIRAFNSSVIGIEAISRYDVPWHPVTKPAE